MSMLPEGRRGPSALLALVAASWTIVGAAPTASATAPTPYTSPFHQSPVRGEPGDLLMIAGHGFSASDQVVYQRVTNITPLPSHPASVPATSTADLGVAPIFSVPPAPVAGPPHSLTVELENLLSGHPYLLWVVNSQGEWSAPIAINDARPLWVSPSVVYSSSPIGGLPRQLKIVGRNLQPVPGMTTKVRLSNGATTYILNAYDDGSPLTAIEHYVARVDLPTNMPTGSYSIAVQRDDLHWAPLADPDALTVLPDPAALNYNVSAFGGCSGNDAVDDTHCVIAAIAAAAPFGGDVVFGSGVWIIDDPTAQGVSANSGIVVPQGVSLRPHHTAVNPRPLVVKGVNWRNGTGYRPVFSLSGENSVSDLRFEDQEQYQPGTYTPFIQIGVGFASPDPVDGITITRNEFLWPYMAIVSNNSPITNLFVTNNLFRAYEAGIVLNGNAVAHTFKYQVQDSVIANNTFESGYYGSSACDNPGTLASAIGASRHLDFSNNHADGYPQSYQNGDPSGWRAAFFFHLSNNHEMTLVSQNTASCTGDIMGDGEAIGYDNNQNTFGFDRAKDVVAATATTIKVSTEDGYGLKTKQNGVDVPLDSYYDQHWLQVAYGPGLGQARKITSYFIATDGSSIEFTVSPAFDVLPVPGQSRIGVSRQYWQSYTVDNGVDNRGTSSGGFCTKANANGLRSAGAIGLAGVATDSAVEGNVLEESGGIQVNALYIDAEGTKCEPLVREYDFKYFVEARGNTIDGEYDYDSGCSYTAGVTLPYSGATGLLTCTTSGDSCVCDDWPSIFPAIPVVPGYGVSVARNTVSHADGRDGGAISFFTGFRIPSSAIFLNTLVHNNSIADQLGDPATTTVFDQCEQATVGCPIPTRGIGVRMGSCAHDTLNYQNAFTSVLTPYSDAGVGNQY